MQNLLQNTAKLLKGSGSSSSELLEARKAITARLEVIDRELRRAKTQELPSVMDSGTQEEIAEIQQKIAELQDEEKTLLARRSRVYKEYQAARQSEAVKAAPASKKALADSTARVEQLAAQLESAKVQLERDVNALKQSRRETGHPALDLDPSLADRLAYILVGDSNQNTARRQRLLFVSELAPRRKAKGAAA